MHNITIITPTTGKDSLDKLIESIADQDFDASVYHLLLWDDYRSEGSKSPESYNSDNRRSIVFPPGTGRNGSAPGSMLRAAGLTLVKTPWVTFADDDVWWEKNHINVLNRVLSNGGNWATTLRKIWSPTGEYLGVDRFESVGDDPGRKVPYEMVDGNTIICNRQFGVSAAPMYSLTSDYNDDRLMYAFLKQHAGPRISTNTPTINQVCPEKLIGFFTENCSKE